MFIFTSDNNCSPSKASTTLFLYFCLFAAIITETKAGLFNNGAGDYDIANIGESCDPFLPITDPTICATAASELTLLGFPSNYASTPVNDDTLQPGCVLVIPPPAIPSLPTMLFNQAALRDITYPSSTYVCVKAPTTSSGGDPHFIGFNQKVVTYQGECTLVLLDSPAATATGDDVMIHVRTTRKLDFSYISGVAMKIGDDIIEITPNADILLNGNVITGEGVTMSGLSFVLRKEEKGTKKMIVSYSFNIGKGRIIDVQANKKRAMMFVRTKGVFPAETVGMLGSPGKEDLVSRDGKVLMSDIDVNTYGESWQVKDSDIQLFQVAVGPQYPQKCLYEDAPGATAQLRGRRKLQAKKVVTVEEARAACADVPGDLKRELCVQDSITMGELDLKDDPFYME